MAILLSDSLDFNESPNFNYIVPAKTTYTFGGAGDGVTIRCVSGQDGDYFNGGVITKKSFVFKPPLYVQFDIRKTPNPGSVFGYAGMTGKPFPLDYFTGGVNGFGISIGSTDFSSFNSATPSGGSPILDPLTLDDWYTFGMLVTDSNIRIFFAESGSPLVEQTPVALTFGSGRPSFGDPIYLQLGRPFYQASGMGFRNVLISSEQFEQPETTTTYDSEQKQFYV